MSPLFAVNSLISHGTAATLEWLQSVDCDGHQFGTDPLGMVQPEGKPDAAAQQKGVHSWAWHCRLRLASCSFSSWEEQVNQGTTLRVCFLIWPPGGAISKRFIFSLEPAEWSRRAGSGGTGCWRLAGPLSQFTCPPGFCRKRWRAASALRCRSSRTPWRKKQTNGFVRKETGGFRPPNVHWGFSTDKEMGLCCDKNTFLCYILCWNVDDLQ